MPEGTESKGRRIGRLLDMPLVVMKKEVGTENRMLPRHPHDRLANFQWRFPSKAAAMLEPGRGERYYFRS